MADYHKYLSWKDLSIFFKREGNFELSEEAYKIASEYYQKYWDYVLEKAMENKKRGYPIKDILS